MKMSTLIRRKQIWEKVSEWTPCVCYLWGHFSATEGRNKLVEALVILTQQANEKLKQVF